MSIVNLKNMTKQSDADRRLQVLVRAEGPTRVLSVVDLQVLFAFLICKIAHLWQTATSQYSGSKIF